MIPVRSASPHPMPNRRLHPVVVGLSHLTAPIALRERVACAGERQDDGPGGEAAALKAAGVADELFLLSTCNRVELYAASADPERAAERLLAALAARGGVGAEALRPHAVVHLRDGAARHLCRVAAGLDSMVIGEAQIAGQLRRAVRAADDAGAMGPTLQRLVGTALAAGKRARARLAPGAAPGSIAEAAVRALGGARALDGRCVLVLGAGEIAAEALRVIAGARPAALAVANRSPERAAALAAQHGAAHLPWEALGAGLAQADVVIACTAAPRAVVTAATLADAPPKARTFLDLGVPRNVHEAVRAVPDVRVLDVDALRFWSGAGAGVDARAVEHGRAAAEREVERWVARFLAWQRARAHVPTIRRLRAEAELVRRAETRRALARLGELSERERAIVEMLSTRLVNKLLHHPLVALATAPESPEWADAVRTLLGHADVRADVASCPVMGAAAFAPPAVRPHAPGHAVAAHLAPEAAAAHVAASPGVAPLVAHAAPAHAAAPAPHVPVPAAPARPHVRSA